MLSCLDFEVNHGELLVLFLTGRQSMASDHCDSCEGRGRTVRGYDGRMIRYPICLGTGRSSGSSFRPDSSSSRRRADRGLPAEIFERRAARLRGSGSGPKSGSCPNRRISGGGVVSFRIPNALQVGLEWLLVGFWFLAGALSNLVVLVPGSADGRDVRRQVFSWVRIAVIWLGLLCALYRPCNRLY